MSLYSGLLFIDLYYSVQMQLMVLEATSSVMEDARVQEMWPRHLEQEQILS